MSTRLVRSTALGLALAAALAAGCGQSDGPAVASTPPASASTLVVHQEGEAMTPVGGCTSTRNTYAGLLCRNDAVSSSASFAQAGRYRFVVRGASSAAVAARAGLYLDTVRVAGLSFTGTAFTDVELTWDVTTPGTKTVRFLMEVDDGTSDTYIDWFELYYEGATPPPPEPPVPPAESAWTSGVYRNLFREWDPAITDAQVQAKLNQWWDSLFASTDDTKRVYYTNGTNANGALAHIRDIGNGDVRSEGMSYGMMIALQMNKQAEFNALWNFVKTYMQHQTGPRKGYIAWQVSTTGSIMDPNPASDGEEYFATALFFAAHRWGNGTGIYNYTAEANAILDTMLHKEDMNAGVLEGVTNMFHRTQKQVVFVPYYTSANFTDPSYHLPAFYELWGRWAAGWNGQTAADRQFWLDAAATSRAFFPRAAHATTGLSPDYAEFTGVPNATGNHADFRFDAWRVAMNWGMDHSWWRPDASYPALADRLQAFFYGQGITSYANQFTLAGAALSSDHSPGLVACNGVASLAATNARRLEFVRELWNLNPPTGQWRYYDGMLSFMSLLHASGNFKIWKPGGGATFPLTVTRSGVGTGTVTSSPAGVSCGATCSASFASGTVVTLTATADLNSSFAGWSGACSGTVTTCPVTMSQARSVTATFNYSPRLYTLTLTKAGTGTGTVNRPVNCGTTCSETILAGTVVTLTATPAVGSTFDGWGGACSGTGSCVVEMTADRAVTATFTFQTPGYTLQLGTSGTGGGLISSIPAGISCGLDCAETYESGTVVTLTAEPIEGSVFAGWSEACSGTGDTCVVTMTEDLFVVASFTATQVTHWLDVLVSGTGTGAVTSSPQGIDCGSVCSAMYAEGTLVTLTAAPASGSTFAGWSGACSGTGACVVTMSETQSVTATFNPQPVRYTLTVTRSGSGSVTSTPAGVSCGTTCSASFAAGTVVTLTATPASGSSFSGWSGACSGTAACVVTMSGARSVAATFSTQPVRYTLSVTRSGTGTVTSTPTGVNCGSTCSASFASGTVVTLTATAATGSSFSGWSGACTGTATTCTVTMSAARSVTATFNVNPILYPLTVTRAGTGSGTVTSAPAGVSCGTACSASFGSASTVTLTATPASGSTFAGWGGACSGTALACTVTMTGAQAVTATFDAEPNGTAPCANAITLTSGNSGNFNTTGAVCYRTSANVAGWGCYNMTGRTVSVNNVAVACGAALPAKWSDGYYYFAFTAGQYPWAGFYYW
ncbi:MAG TPA: glycosyl hydrolase family 8 [Anaeromyxobacter sp.]|nr:glycosyl hydrolase family 8 [Anaeromyxobacter sp.]